MPGFVRPPDEIARLTAAAKAMRRGGATQFEISQALNVSGSTIARWAAEGGWRVSDMAGEIPREASAQLPPLDCDAAPDAPVLPDLDPELGPVEAARQLMARAITATNGGQVMQAERLVRIAERFSRLAGLVPEPDIEEGPSLEELRAELNARLNRVRYSMTVEQMEAAATKGNYIMTDAAKEAHRAMRRKHGYKD